MWEMDQTLNSEKPVHNLSSCLDGVYNNETGMYLLWWMVL